MVRTISISLIVVFTAFSMKAAESNTKISSEAGYIIHLLNYLGNDYSHAVANGKIISEAEYEEMEEFAFAIENTTTKINPDKSLSKIATNIKSLVLQKADPIQVKLMCDSARKLLIAAYNIKTFPLTYPSISKGAITYISECAKCHGDKGFGDGKEGELLDPAPRNFHDAERIKSIAPFAAFNTIKYGIEGTGMLAHTNLSDDDIWNTAFYILALRHPQNTEDYKTQRSLEQIATLSDEEIEENFPEENIASLRHIQPTLNEEEDLSNTFSYIKEAKNACLKGDFETVDKLITLAYLEGIEPKESIIKEINAELIPGIEKKISEIRKSIKAKKRSDVMAGLKELEVELKAMDDLLKKSNIKPVITLFLSVSILLREGIEALLVIIIFMNVLGASNHNEGKKYVHFGWISALTIGVALWLLLGNLISESKLNVEIMEGVITLSAIALMIYVGFWLHKKSSIDDWKNYIKSKINGDNKLSTIWGVFSLTFLVVFREIFESILFISSIDLQSNGQQRLYILAGCAIAFIIIVAFYQIATRLSKNLPFKKLINFSLIILAALSVILMGKGIHSFQEANLISQTTLPLPSIDVLGFFPSIETIAAQIATALGLTILFSRMSKKQLI
jgi:high-affinity iron transporter